LKKTLKITILFQILQYSTRKETVFSLNSSNKKQICIIFILLQWKIVAKTKDKSKKAKKGFTIMSSLPPILIDNLSFSPKFWMSLYYFVFM
jgi:hypothetical protein